MWLRRASPARVPVTLAWTVDPTWSPNARTTRIEWSEDASAALRGLGDAARSNRGEMDRGLPVAALRAALAATLAGATCVNEDLGGPASSRRQDRRTILAIVVDGGPDDVLRANAVVSRWVDRCLTPWAARNGIPDEALATMRRAARAGSVRETWSRNAGLEREALFGALAKALRGREVFPGLGPVRLETRSGPSSNVLRLVTWPTQGPAGAWSMVASLHVETVGGLRQPVVRLDVDRRRYATRVPETRMLRGQRKVVAHVMAELGGDSVTLTCPLIKVALTGHDMPELALEAMGVPLPAAPVALADRIGRAPVDGGFVGIMVGDATADLTEVGSGATERDLLDAHDAVAALLRGVLAPLATDPVATPPPIGRAAPVASSLRLAGVLLGNSPDDWEAAFGGTLPRGMTPARAAAALHALDLAGEAAARALGDARVPGAARVVAYVPDDEGASLVGAVLRRVLPGGCGVEVRPPPAGVVGPRLSLPFAAERNADRFARRLAAWRGEAASLDDGTPTAAVVAAPDPGDDPINAHAARVALATYGDADVGQAHPPEVGPGPWARRLGSTAVDLLTGHRAAHAPPGADVRRAFEGSRAVPRVLIGASLVRRVRRAAGEPPVETLLVTRTEVADGTVTARFGHLVGGIPSLTPEVPLAAAMREATRLPVTTLGDANLDKAVTYQTLLDAVVRQSCERGESPLVLVQSTEAHGLWESLDAGLPEGSTLLGRPFAAHRDWPGARVVRVRRHEAPTTILRASLSVTDASDGTERVVDAPVAAARLDRVRGAEPPHYVSMASRALAGVPRGASAHGRKAIPVPVADVGEVPPWGAFAGRLADPDLLRVDCRLQAPVAFTIVAQAMGDDPDRIAALVHGTRRDALGRTSRMPSPLSHEHLLRAHAPGLLPLDVGDERVDGLGAVVPVAAPDDGAPLSGPGSLVGVDWLRGRVTSSGRAILAIHEAERICGTLSRIVGWPDEAPDEATFLAIVRRLMDVPGGIAALDEVHASNLPPSGRHPFGVFRPFRGWACRTFRQHAASDAEAARMMAEELPAVLRVLHGAGRHDLVRDHLVLAAATARDASLLLHVAASLSPAYDDVVPHLSAAAAREGATGCGDGAAVATPEDVALALAAHGAEADALVRLLEDARAAPPDPARVAALRTALGRVEDARRAHERTTSRLPPSVDLSALLPYLRDALAAVGAAADAALPDGPVTEAAHAAALGALSDFEAALGKAHDAEVRASVLRAAMASASTGEVAGLAAEHAAVASETVDARARAARCLGEALSGLLEGRAEVPGPLIRARPRAMPSHAVEVASAPAGAPDADGRERAAPEPAATDDPFWSLRGPATTMSAVVRAAASSGACGLVMPDRRPPRLASAIDAALAGAGLRPVTLPPEEGRPLLARVARALGIEGAALATTASLLAAPEAADVAVVASCEDLPEWREWSGFLRQFTATRRALGSASAPCVVLVVPVDIPHGDVTQTFGRSRVRWMNRVTSSDARVLAMRTSGLDVSGTLVERVALETIVALGGYDAALIGHLSTLAAAELVDAVDAVRRMNVPELPLATWSNGWRDEVDGRAHEHTLSLAGRGAWLEVERRAWLAHQRVVMPLVDDVLAWFCARYRDTLERGLPMTIDTPSGTETITVPRELEPSTMRRLLEGVCTQAEWALLRTVGAVRNRVAHLEPVPPVHLEALSEAWETILTDVAAMATWDWPRSGQRLTLMVGPSGGGKTTHVERSFDPADVVRPDEGGRDAPDAPTGAAGAALRATVRRRLASGDDAVVDAPNLRRSDRLALVDLVPEDFEVEYLVVDRPMAEKLAVPGWRAGQPGVVRGHQAIFEAELEDVLRGDGRPNVMVTDLRQPAVAREAAE